MAHIWSLTQVSGDSFSDSFQLSRKHFYQQGTTISRFKSHYNYTTPNCVKLKLLRLICDMKTKLEFHAWSNHWSNYFERHSPEFPWWIFASFWRPQNVLRQSGNKNKTVHLKCWLNSEPGRSTSDRISIVSDSLFNLNKFGNLFIVPLRRWVITLKCFSWWMSFEQKDFLPVFVAFLQPHPKVELTKGIVCRWCFAK